MFERLKNVINDWKEEDEIQIDEQKDDTEEQSKQSDIHGRDFLMKDFDRKVRQDVKENKEEDRSLSMFIQAFEQMQKIDISLMWP